MSEAIQLLNEGMAWIRSGDFRQAATVIEEANRQSPDEPSITHFLGLALCKSGRFDEGIVWMRRSLELAPRNRGFATNYANLLFEFRQSEEAEAIYRQLVAEDPAQQFAWKNLGVLLLEKGDLVGAEESARQALTLNEQDAVAHNVLGCVLRQRRAIDEAIVALRRAVELAPAVSDYALNLALALSDVGRFDEALPLYETAIRLNPDSVSAYTSLGLVSFIQGRMDVAAAAYAKGLAIDPTFPKLRNNAGLLAYEQGRYDEGREHFREAINSMPAFSQPKTNWGILELTCGNFQLGWELYENRFDCPDMGIRRYESGERWTGQSLAGKKIYVLSEQGFGDTINFARFVPRLVALGAEVVFECQRPLLNVLTLNMAQEGLEFLPRGEREPQDCDYWVSLLSLPGIFRVDASTIPPVGPAWRATEASRHLWAARLQHLGYPRIGVCWAGSSTHRHDRHRSIALEDFRDMFVGVNAQLISLRRHDGLRDTGEPAVDQAWPAVFDPSRLLNDYNDTAACIEGMNLVVTVDTSVAHLAACMGKPVWLMLPYVPDWRWLLERADTPWYPSVRLFRQHTYGDWQPVLAEVRQALLDWQA